MLGKPQILKFIQSNTLMVLSTINATGSSSSALVGFGETDSFQLIFGTSNTSRKYANILVYPKVSAVIGWGDSRTVQYEGIGRELSGSEVDKYSEVYFTKTPSARQYKHLDDERYFLIQPTWIRYTDLSVDPWDITELKF